MKLVRFGSPSEEKPGIVDKQGRIRDLSSVVVDIDASVLCRAGIEALRGVSPDSLPLPPRRRPDPPRIRKTDWEVELAIVIGEKASYVSEKEALEFVAGYCAYATTYPNGPTSSNAAAPG